MKQYAYTQLVSESISCVFEIVSYAHYLFVFMHLCNKQYI